MSPPPGPKSGPAPRMGDVAGMCSRVDRLGAIEEKISWLIKSFTALDRRLAVVEAKGGKARK
jgi:hypothetical protein